MLHTYRFNVTVVDGKPILASQRLAVAASRGKRCNVTVSELLQHGTEHLRTITNTELLRSSSHSVFTGSSQSQIEHYRHLLKQCIRDPIQTHQDSSFRCCCVSSPSPSKKRNNNNNNLYLLLTYFFLEIVLTDLSPPTGFCASSPGQAAI